MVDSLSIGAVEETEARDEQKRWCSGFLDAWIIDLDQHQQSVSEFWETLSEDERSRANRFHFDLHRNRFVTGRGMLRKVLSRYLSRLPELLKFQYGPQGKPELQDKEFSFNLSHSENVSIIAVCDKGLVGADIEKLRQIPERDMLVTRFFTVNEARRFSAIEESQKQRAFFNLWTRKEAWLKATGEGITHLLNRVEVSFLPDEKPALLSLPAEFGSPHQWSLASHVPLPDFVCSVATGSECPAPSFLRFPTGGLNDS